MTTKLEADLRILFETQTRSLGEGAPPPLAERTLVPDGMNRERRRPLAIAAALLLIVGGAASWWAIDARGKPTPADQPGNGLMPTEPPLLRLDAPGWTPTSFSDTDPSLTGESSAMFIVPDEGILGPQISVYLTGGGAMPITDDEPTPVTVGGQPARLLIDGDRAQVRWTEPGGEVLEAVGTLVDIDDLIDAAELIVVVDGLPAATGPLPAGLVPLTGREAELARTWYEYQWLDTEGRGLQVSLHPGGRPVYEERLDVSGAVEATTVEFHGAEAHVARYDNMIQLAQLRGFWVVEVSGFAEPVTDPETLELSDGATNFESIDEFLAVAEQLTTVDPIAWRAALPPDVVLPSEIAVVAAELSVFDLPEGHEAPTIETVTQPRHAIAQTIAVQTTCTWMIVLDDAIEADDSDAAIAAAAVIHDVASWDELAGIGDTFLETEFLTAIGRIRAVDAALADLRRIDAAQPDVRLDDLQIDAALDSVMAAKGIELDCPAG